MTPAWRLFDEHVRRFNAGVREGSFDAMVELFADDAELVFEGIPVGPFAGRDDIAAAYRDRPPDDEIDVFDVREEAGVVRARYAWRRHAGTPAGELRLTAAGDEIRRLVVTFPSA